MSYFRFLLILFFYFIFFSSKAELSNFEKGKNLFDNKKYDLAKFKFEKDIVFNPKNENSYLYLSKIFKLKKRWQSRRKKFKNYNLIKSKKWGSYFKSCFLKKENQITQRQKLIKDLKKFAKLYVKNIWFRKKLDALLKK